MIVPENENVNLLGVRVVWLAKKWLRLFCGVIAGRKWTLIKNEISHAVFRK